MNTSELEMLIRNILSEQLTPEKTQTKGNGIFQTVDEAIRAAHQAFLRYQQCPLKTRSAIIHAIREELAPHLASLAEESAAETGMGNKEDKLLKTKPRWITHRVLKISPQRRSPATAGWYCLNIRRLALSAPLRPALTRQKRLLITASVCWRRETAFILALIPAQNRCRSS